MFGLFQKKKDTLAQTQFKWDFLIHCPNCGKEIAGLNPTYDISLERNGDGFIYRKFEWKPNGRVNVFYHCTACESKGQIVMQRPKYNDIEV